MKTTRTLKAIYMVTIFSFFFACDTLKTETFRKEEIVVNQTTIEVEIAATAREREKGLMYRTSLPQDTGMLFIFPEVKYQSFWMKNTLIPLDVAFFDDQGFLIEVITMRVDSGEKIYTSSEPAKYGLEMNAGWFKRKGIRKYARLKFSREIPAL